MNAAARDFVTAGLSSAVVYTNLAELRLPLLSHVELLELPPLSTQSDLRRLACPLRRR